MANPALHQVYDVSKFMEEHPGGEEVMLNVTGKRDIERNCLDRSFLLFTRRWKYAGKDASFDFEDIGHSSYAEGLMKDLCIGEIDQDTLPEATEVPSSSYKVKEETGDSSSTFLLYVVPPLILGAAFLLRFYSGNQ